MMDLVDRVQVLRDEVLDIVAGGSEDAPAVAIFDAVVRALAVGVDTAGGLDLTLHDAVARRLAWGDSEESILSDAELVFARLARAAQRALRDPDEEMLVLETAALVVGGAARIVALAAVARSGRDRAAALREDLAQRRLKEALAEQQRTLARLEAGRAF
ncbi:MAG: hypothetical protein HS111_35470 [Kofleriaceae bacterium]|nr:hypothetical protein [Kofleriaceae bacterium]MCL4224489.1 hypothetical protein [Myxococcales bacterium]